MGRIALALATIALVVSVLPSGVFVGMGLAGMAACTGWLGYRRQAETGWMRLAGAGAMTLAAFALLISTGRFFVAYWAVGRLRDAFAG